MKIVKALVPVRRQENWLSYFGPLSLLLPLSVWAGGLILGLGDVPPNTSLARLLLVVESGMGFAFLAPVIGYLPALNQSFARREVSISLLDARAGSLMITGWTTGGEVFGRALPRAASRPGKKGQTIFDQSGYEAL